MRPIWGNKCEKKILFSSFFIGSENVLSLSLSLREQRKMKMLVFFLGEVFFSLFWRFTKILRKNLLAFNVFVNKFNIFSAFNTSTASRTSGYVLKIIFDIQSNVESLEFVFDLLIGFWVCSEVSSVASFRAVAEILSGDSRIFSGEGVQFRCSVPDPHMSTWDYRWFKGSEELMQHKQILVLWAARIDDTGNFSCQGLRTTQVGDVLTLQSLPVEIFVDGKINITTNILQLHPIIPLSSSVCYKVELQEIS